jgi:hypothetical protein
MDKNQTNYAWTLLICSLVFITVPGYQIRATKLQAFPTIPGRLHGYPKWFNYSAEQSTRATIMECKYLRYPTCIVPCYKGKKKQKPKRSVYKLAHFV